MSVLKLVVIIGGFLACWTSQVAALLPEGLVPESNFNLVNANTIFPQSPFVQHSVALGWFGQASETSGNITIVGKDVHDIRRKLNELNPDFEEFNARQLEPERRVASVADGPYQVIEGDNWVRQRSAHPNIVKNSLTRILAYAMQP